MAWEERGRACLLLYPADPVCIAHQGWTDHSMAGRRLQGGWTEADTTKQIGMITEENRSLCIPEVEITLSGVFRNDYY